MKSMVAAGMAAAVMACTAPGGSGPAASPPQPEERLRAMSDFLAGVNDLRLTTRETHTFPGPSGEEVTFEGTRETTIWRPDALRETLRGKSPLRELHLDLYYDGLTLTLEHHTRKIWAQAEVAPSLDEMLDEVAWRFDLPLPVADMLYSSPYDALFVDGTKGEYVGGEDVEGRACHRLSFTGPTVDWEVWIQAEGEPRPCRLDIVHKEMEGRPTSQIVVTGLDPDPDVEESLFAFEPEDGYHRIPVVENPPPGASDDQPPTDEGRTP